jgi:hypothetical protein
MEYQAVVSNRVDLTDGKVCRWELMQFRLSVKNVNVGLGGLRPDRLYNGDSERKCSKEIQRIRCKLTVETAHGLLRVDRTISTLLKGPVAVNIARGHGVGVEAERNDGCDALNFVSAAQGDQPAYKCKNKGTSYTLSNNEISLTIAVQGRRVYISLECKSSFVFPVDVVTYLVPRLHGVI